MSRQDISIKVPDGEARAFVFTPDSGQGPWPAVLFFMDGVAIRPALFEMGERLASNGYFVLLPDMFWRLGPYEPLVPKEALADPEKRQAIFSKFMTSTDPKRSMDDVGAFLDWMATQPQARPGKVGVHGYCMGAQMALRAAGTFPDRIAAAGCFHGGNMATDDPTSPHLLADKITAKVLVAGGDEDAHFNDAECARLDKALKDGGVDAEVTIYRGAHHGYAPPDMPPYDHDAAERHWRELLALYGETLKEPAIA